MNTLVRPALVLFVALSVLTGLVYPLAATGVAQAAFPHQAAGSLITDPDGRIRGSTLLAQPFAGPGYFHPRPSAAGAGYDAASSGGSNLGPTSQKLRDQVAGRVTAYRAANGLAATVLVPADAATASASGLDPHISPRNAELQAARVAQTRGWPTAHVQALVRAFTEPPQLGLFGDPRVNVLRLNRALDAASARPLSRSAP